MTTKKEKYVDGCDDCRSEFVNCFKQEFEGVASVGLLEKSLWEHARALRVTMEEEAAKPFPNNALVALLRDAACLGFEHVERIMKSKSSDSSKGEK